MITIIEKVELGNNGEIIDTEVGYTENVSLVNKININYDESMGEFIGRNKTNLDNEVVFMSAFFETTPVVYMACTITDAERPDLKEIFNIDEL
tara:strand:- start:742 stop:1020 length:279 start_codon:yes stop_codon:yes gene_type:complete